MSEEQMWLVAFGRGWVDHTEIEDSGDTLFSLYVLLARSNRLEYDVEMNLVKLREENELIRV
jgi:hypothetical protein